MTPARRPLRENAEAMGLPVFPADPDPLRCAELTPDEVMALRNSRLFKNWSDQT